MSSTQILNSIVGPILFLILAVLAYFSPVGQKIKSHFTRLPLSSYSARQLDIVFMGNPKLREHYTNRGGMSMYEHRKELELQLSRIKHQQKLAQSQSKSN